VRVRLRVTRQGGDGAGIGEMAGRRHAGRTADDWSTCLQLLEVNATANNPSDTGIKDVIVCDGASMMGMVMTTIEGGGYGPCRRAVGEGHGRHTTEI
jgi:hypothetical protein